MANKPQTLSQGQREEVVGIVRKKVLTWVSIGFAILGAVAGVGLWQITEYVKQKMQDLVASQFEEPKIRQTVEDVAAARAASIIRDQVEPEVARFKGEVNQRIAELEQIASRMKELAQQSQEREKSIQSIFLALQKVLNESQQTRDRIVGLQSDIVKMQKCAAKLEYYTLKGRNTFPNPYKKEMADAFNEMMSIAVPDPMERSKFINALGGPDLSK